jgi:hypothetical protein
MITADVQPYSEYDSYGNDYDKSNNNAVSVKKVECDINNININEVELNLGLPTTNVLNGLSNNGTQAATDNEGETVNGLESDDSNNNNADRQKDRDSSFVCINNNNNTGTNGADEEPISEEPAL